jgi:hypothetical protein
MSSTRRFRPLSEKPKLSGDELLRAVGGQLTGVPPAMAEPLPPAAAEPAKRTAPRAAPFVLRLSPGVFFALERAAEREGTTITVMIARALKDAGYPVPERDLRDRRRRRDYAALAHEGE